LLGLLLRNQNNPSRWYREYLRSTSVCIIGFIRQW